MKGSLRCRWFGHIWTAESVPNDPPYPPYWVWFRCTRCGHATPEFAAEPGQVIRMPP